MNQAKRMENAPLSGIRKIVDYSNKLEAQGAPIVHMEIGEPDFNTPKYIVDSVKKALDNNHVHYGPIVGIEPLRKAIASYYNSRFGTDYEAHEVQIISGAAHGIFVSIMAYLNPGDEILIPDPGYLCYMYIPNIAEAKIVPYVLREEDEYQINPEIMESLITKKTKAIILNSPSNPMGFTLNKKSIECVANLAQEHDLLIIEDNIYSRIMYDKTPFHSVIQIPAMKERTIVLDGFSKYYVMMGWRIGYMIADKSLMNPLMRLTFYSISCPNTFVQDAALAAMTQETEELGDNVKEYQKRRDYLVKALNELPGCSCKKPNGAFYIWLNIKGTGFKSQEFCERMLDTAYVSMTPGPVFGESCEGYVRISYANSLENCKEAIRRMKKFLEENKR
jgi:aminotransferase